MRRIIMLACLLTTSTFAKDAISASVTNFNLMTPVVAVNGNPYAAGNFAVGTIQLFYTVNQYQFTAGQIATFELDLQDVQVNTTGQTPNYPVTLNLTHVGSPNVGLSPSGNNFSVTGPGWSTSTMIAVSIPASVASNPALNADGTDLVGNLQLSTSPQGSKLDTTTTVQVHIRLAYPQSCLRLYNFMTTQDLIQSVTSLQVKLYKNGPKAGQTQNTTPPQLSDNVMVVNTCSVPEAFDLMINIDPSFSSNQGNPVFMYTKSGSSDPSAFNIADFGPGTPKGTAQCFGSITLAPNDTLLTTVHMSIAEFPASQLPASGNFSFSALAAMSGSGCPGTLNTLAVPNPAGLSVPFTIAP